MRPIARFAVAGLAFAASTIPTRADEVTDAIEQGRKSYQSGDLAGAKQALDRASQLIGQKNAEAFGQLLPAALAGWQAEPVQTAAVAALGLGASTASRTYTKANGDSIEVQITGDSAIVVQYGTFLSNPTVADAMGKIVPVGTLRALQTMDGDIHMVVSNRYLVSVQGTARRRTRWPTPARSMQRSCRRCEKGRAPTRPF
jgi:hypothetical protein